MQPSSANDNVEFKPGDQARCFLCREVLTADTQSSEHIIPKWMIEAFELRGDICRLSNGSAMPMAQFRIHCCRACNNGHLSRMEEDFQRYVYRPKIPLKDVPDLLIMQWCAKFAFSRLVKQTLVPNDRREPAKGAVLDGIHVDYNADLLAILGSVREPMQFGCPKSRLPATVYKFNVARIKGGNARNDFDIFEGVGSRVVAVRLRERGHVVVFDGGIGEKYKHKNPWLTTQDVLLPAQFDEIVAMLVYRHARCRFHHRYEEEPTARGTRLVQAEALLFSDDPDQEDTVTEYSPYDHASFVEILERYTGRKQPPEIVEKGEFVTTLARPVKGRFLALETRTSPAA